MEHSRAAKLAPFLAFAALVGLAYVPLFWGQILFQRDISRWIYPEQTFLSHSLANADSPLWNPLIGLGLSTLSNPLNQIVYPPNLLLLVGHSPRSTSFFLVAHILLGGVGMMILTRRLTKHTVIPGLVAGLAWGLSGYTTSEVTAGLRLIAGAYLPWCALGILGLSRTIRDAPSVRAMAGATAGAAIPFGLCFLTGEVFIPLLAGAFALSVAAGDILENSAPTGVVRLRTWAWRFGLGVCAAAVLATGLASAVLLPLKHTTVATARTAPLSRSIAEVGSFHPWRLAEMIAPGAMGDPYTAYPAGSWVGDPGLGDRPLLYGCYLGSSVLVLALLAFGRNRKLATALGALAFFALLVAFGKHTGVHAVVRTLFPPLAYMRGPEKYLALVVACVSLLSGLGTARLLESKERAWPRGLLVVVALVLLVFVAGLFPSVMVAQVRSSAMTGLAFALATTAVVWVASRSSRLAGPLLSGLVFVDLSLSVFALQNFGSPDLLAAKPAAATAVLADARLQGGVLAPPRVYRSEKVDAAIADAAPPTSVTQVQRNLVRTLIDNHAGSFGIATVPGYDAAMPSTLSALWLGGRAMGRDLLRLTGVEYAILPDTGADRPGFRRILDPVPGSRLFRVEGVLPRVYLSQAAAVMPDGPALRAVFATEVVAGKHVILAPTPAPPASVAVGEPTAQDLGGCRLTAYAHARIEADCRVTAPALAIFLEQFDQGWSAAVDGQAAPLLRANLAMRAVPLLAGHHRIVLSFSPPGLWIGLTISLAGLVATVLALVLGRRRLARHGPAVMATRSDP
jgi:hypothetical protein